jgi:predicted transposase YbfD/YdcC
LLKDIEQTIATSEFIDCFQEYDSSHGRQINRITTIYDASESMKAGQWSALKTYIKVHRTRKVGNITKYENAYYMSSSRLTAEDFHEAIRKHWGIENKLHWVKDVVFNEDENRIRCGNGPIAASIFSTIAINIHRKNGNESITNGIILFRAKIAELFNIIRT